MANSTTVVAGDAITAAKQNALRADVLDPSTGHDHSGAADHGKKIAPAVIDPTGSTSGQVVRSTGPSSAPTWGAGVTLGSATPLVESGTGSTGTSANAAHADHVHPAALPSLSNASAQLAADVTMTNANTYYDGPSVSLSAGTWIILASITVSTSNGQFTGRLWNGSTVYASTEQAALFGVPATLTLSLVTPPVVLAGSTTVKVSVAADTASTVHVLCAAAPQNGAGNNATTIVALRIA